MLSWMNTSKQIAMVCLTIIILALLACGSLPLDTKDNAAPAYDGHGTAMSAARTIVAQTMAAIPTSTVIPTNTLLVPTSTSTSIPAPTPTPLPFVKLDGLREAYTIGGDLYVQDSGEQAVQLTYGGQDSAPVFSDDGKKIAFSREWKTEMNELHVINVDGTGEQALITSKLLIARDFGYDEFAEPDTVAFIPGTHLLLLNTHYFRPEHPKQPGSYPTRSNDLLLADTDTGELKQLRAPRQGGFFLASPNGKWIAVQSPDHVEVIDIQGQVVLHDLASHSPDAYDCNYYGYMCSVMFWRQDSRELILVQPISLSEIPTNRTHPLARTLWRYPINGKPGFEIRLDIFPGGEALSVSPDGNWIAFSLFDIGSQDGVYLGNLHEGISQLIYQPPFNEATGFRDPVPLDYYGWSPDSMYFAFGDSSSTLIGNIYGEVAIVGWGGICGWIDKNHYLDGCGTLNEVGTRESVRIMEFPSGISGESITFVYRKH